MDEEKKEVNQTEEKVEETVKDSAPAPESSSEPEAKNDRPEKPDKKEKKKDKEKKKETDRVAELTAELAAGNDKYLRLCAEYDNFRRRSQKEKDAIYGDVRSEVIQKFLPVYDNLERALRQSTEDEAYRRGVEMIKAQFDTTLEKLGVTAIESLGKTFDPSLHNAVMHVEDAEKGENEIVEVFQQGFLMGDKVVRFAMVKVAN